MKYSFRNHSKLFVDLKELGWGSICKSWHYFANKRRSLGRHSSLADQSHGVVVVGVDWMYLAQDRDYWQALVNTVMNLRVP
jgi:hypothetical protein